MASLSIHPSLTVGRFAASAAIALALSVPSAEAAEISFVEGKVEAKEFTGSGDCSRVTLERFDARGDVISGSWYDPTGGSGYIEIIIK